MSEDTPSGHVHEYDSDAGCKFIGDALMLSCECGATKLFAPEAKEKKPGKLLQFPAVVPPSRTE